MADGQAFNSRSGVLHELGSIGVPDAMAWGALVFCKRSKGDDDRKRS